MTDKKSAETSSEPPIGQGEVAKNHKDQLAELDRMASKVRFKLDKHRAALDSALDRDQQASRKGHVASDDPRIWSNARREQEAREQAERKIRDIYRNYMAATIILSLIDSQQR
ncbi:hypothetical protein GGTG_03463 [Gaeumannomyces tritici R3-111a-1]|uniref:Uncharacterized protein n=1 Tax=Gaeumannomyces tritici (strain R3-111a-1) TaxID=644352 RepID=J3NQA6_GAET3|nr:hypothetical protein GGTG_03463 [Gaeumannomyces tritici R3-111a-1]EJT78362.1 hypothetical protein GGTG_03463 [Gaeumannomyces tritici R3-111a-1]